MPGKLNLRADRGPRANQFGDRVGLAAGTLDAKMERRISAFFESAADRRVGGSRGVLNVGLHVTRLAIEEGLPILPARIRTSKESGQVRGLTRARIQGILRDHGIDRQLTAEAGRTSRGSLTLAHDYATLLNGLDEGGLLGASSTQRDNALGAIQDWWVGKVRDFFNHQTLPLSLDMSKSTSELIADVLQEAHQRQQGRGGETYEGAVLQHLVGAKLEVIRGKGRVKHEKVSSGDAQTGRYGDFDLDDFAVHVTVSPGALVIERCKRNINQGKKPLLIVPEDVKDAATQLAKIAGISERLEIYGAEQYLSSNITERGAFSTPGLKLELDNLVETYNSIIRSVESDQSLAIQAK